MASEAGGPASDRQDPDGTLVAIPVADALAPAGAQNSPSIRNGEPQSERPLGNFKNVILDIRNMERLIGTRLYRGLLKEVARVFYPEDIRKIALQHKVLALMMSAGRGLDRLRSASAKVSDSTVRSILNAAELQSFDDIGDMATLQQVVLGLGAPVAVETSDAVLRESNAFVGSDFWAPSTGLCLKTLPRVSCDQFMPEVKGTFVVAE